ncbi:lasso peptide biosynthesis B2 protein [Streptomyces sp. NPDC051214]|uniref:lasso peptide biosynthesis B2 protein n=1 Tax=Streptomyces sp. NPDC051214 TaxID=3155282 RepID=UPI00341C9E33
MAPRHTTASAAPLLVCALAVICLALAIPGHRFPLPWLMRAMSVLRRFPPAEPDFARRVHEAALAARPSWWGGRIACMEVSLATVLALGLCRRRVSWVLGARALPNEAHAWIQGDGFTLGLDEDDPVRPWTPLLITPEPPTRKGE